MTTYDASAVSNSVIAHEKGITLQQGRALRDNPIAIAEGSAGAPRVQGQALGNVLVDHGNLTSWGLSATANVERAKEFFAMLNYSTDSTAGTKYVRARLSDDNGATWAALSNLHFFTSPDSSFSAQFSVDVETGAFVFGGTASGSTTTGTMTLPTGAVNAISIGVDGNGITGNGALFCVGGIS